MKNILTCEQEMVGKTVDKVLEDGEQMAIHFTDGDVVLLTYDNPEGYYCAPETTSGSNMLMYEKYDLDLISGEEYQAHVEEQERNLAEYQEVQKRNRYNQYLELKKEFGDE